MGQGGENLWCAAKLTRTLEIRGSRLKRTKPLPHLAVIAKFHTKRHRAAGEAGPGEQTWLMG